MAVILALLAALHVAAAVVTTGSVSCRAPRAGCVFTPAIRRDQNAYGWFENTVAETGWSTFTGVANTAMPMSNTSYALGFLEGVLTADLIWPMYLNMRAPTFDALSPDTVRAMEDFVDHNTRWVQTMVASNPTSIYWQRVGSMYDQLAGLAAGYQSVVTNSSQNMTLHDFALLSAMADLDDIGPAVNASLRPHVDFSEQQAAAWMRRHGHCSSVVRFTAAMDDLLAAHNTWTTYSLMLRTFKYYTYSDATIAMSSYPGCLTSTDDFLQTSTKLVVMETTLPVFNGSIYSLIHPEAVFSWTRTLVATRLARNGSHWAALFGQYNSGTYNNAWLVVDYNKFTPGHPLKAGTLTLLEQLPGHIHSDDLTTYLWTGTFPSFNRAFFADTAALCGQTHVERSNPTYSYQGSTRSKIFRRDADSIDNINALQRIMRYNNYLADPFSHKDPSEAIAARYDLMAQDPEAGGAIDAKCTSSALVRDMRVMVVSGPTWDEQPVFEWTEQFQGTAHYGQPDRFQFPWVQMVSPA
eukprot:m.234677 g.234677  ORF g.234677 m.234677 type:complete len:523 (+) comp12695_c0_seq1:41-1609(+)